jgi:hypothetical protein
LKTKGRKYNVTYVTYVTYDAFPVSTSRRPHESVGYQQISKKKNTPTPTFHAYFHPFTD